MKIGDRVFVHGYIDEIRKDIVIIRNNGGYFGTVPDEIVTSAQQEQRWIPCSERLPEDDTLMLVNYIDHRPDAMDIWIGWHEMENVWYIDGEAHGEEYGNEVIAWMPLPEPYQGEGEQE